MPEGPEIRWMVNDLSKHFEGSFLEKVTVKSGRYIRHPFPKLDPGIIKEIWSHGKFIWILVSTSVKAYYYVWITLGLTGHIGRTPNQDRKFIRVVFTTDRGNFYFTDMRNFGTIRKRQGLDKLLKLGTDPLDYKITNLYATKFLNKYPKKKVGELLLDQGFAAGVGNYLRAEILYDARINPYRTAESLNKKDITKLVNSINKVVNRAYKNPDDKFRVYKKKKDPYGNNILKGELGKRTIWYSPLQK